jgi:hypothetical protein
MMLMPHVRCTTLRLRCGVCNRSWAEEIPAPTKMDSVLLKIRAIRCRCRADYHAIYGAKETTKQNRVAA